MTTFASFVSSMGGLTITGVERTWTSTPESIGTADLPAQFIRLPDGEAAYAPDDCISTGKTRNIELVVCIEPAALEVAKQNFADTIAMMDYIETALDAWNAAQNSMLFSYSISTSGNAPVFIGDTAYWAVIAAITGVG